MITWLTLAVALSGFGPDPMLPGNPYVLRGHQGAVVAVAFSPDSKQVASLGRDKTLKLWRLDTGELLRSVALEFQQPSCLTFNATGDRIAVGDLTLQVAIFDVANGQLVKAIAHPDAVSGLAFSPDGLRIAVAGAGANGAVYEIASGKKVFDVKASGVQFSADGKTLFTATPAGRVWLVNAATGKASKDVQIQPTEDAHAVFASDGSRVASWTIGNPLPVSFWSLEGKQGPTLTIAQGAMGRVPAPLGVALDARSTRALMSAADGTLRLWDVEKRTELKRWPAEMGLGVALSPQATWVAVTEQSIVKLWPVTASPSADAGR